MCVYKCLAFMYLFIRLMWCLGLVEVRWRYRMPSRARAIVSHPVIAENQISVPCKNDKCS